MLSGEVLTWSQEATTEVLAEVDLCHDKRSRERGPSQLPVAYISTSAILIEVRQLDDVFHQRAASLR